MVETKAVRERAMNELLVNISQDLAERVSAKTGLASRPRAILKIRRLRRRRPRVRSILAQASIVHPRSA